MERTKVFKSGAFSSPLVDCRIADLKLETTALRFSQRARFEINSNLGCSFQPVPDRSDAYSVVLLCA